MGFLVGGWPRGLGAAAVGFGLLALGGAAPVACAPDARPEPERPFVAQDQPVPAGFPAGTFFWRVIRGDRDKLDDYKKLRERVEHVLAKAARFPASGAGQGATALETLREARETFDETHEPRELEATVAWFDRTEAPAAEGLEVTLTRHVSGEPDRTLRVTTEDLAAGGAVDGRIDRVRIFWAPRGEPGAGAKAPGQLLIELGEEDGQIVERVEVADQARYRVTAPEVTALYAAIQQELYQPLSGSAFVRVARAGPLPPRFRPAQPQGTSFPAPPAEIH